MKVLIDKSDEKTLGENIASLLKEYDNLNDKELVINSNSSNTQRLFLETIEKIIIENESILFYGENNHYDFLNLNNVLSISILGDY